MFPFGTLSPFQRTSKRRSKKSRLQGWSAAMAALNMDDFARYLPPQGE
jgi:hypothetical protein